MVLHGDTPASDAAGDIFRSRRSQFGLFLRLAHDADSPSLQQQALHPTSPFTQPSLVESTLPGLHRQRPFDEDLSENVQSLFADGDASRF